MAEGQGLRPSWIYKNGHNFAPLCHSTWCLVLGWGFRLSLVFYHWCLHTCTAVAHDPCVSWAFLFSIGVDVENAGYWCIYDTGLHLSAFCGSCGCYRRTIGWKSHSSSTWTASLQVVCDIISEFSVSAYTPPVIEFWSLRRLQETLWIIVCLVSDPFPISHALFLNNIQCNQQNAFSKAFGTHSPLLISVRIAGPEWRAWATVYSMKAFNNIGLEDDKIVDMSKHPSISVS